MESNIHRHFGEHDLQLLPLPVESFRRYQMVMDLVPSLQQPHQMSDIVLGAVLFGSTVMGTATEKSDIDIAFILKQPLYRSIPRSIFNGELEKQLIGSGVELGIGPNQIHLTLVAMSWFDELPKADEKHLVAIQTTLDAIKKEGLMLFRNEA